MATCADCAARAHQTGERAVDNTAWDGPAAMSRCANSDTPASCYGSICAGKKAGDSSLQSSWALPHHKNAGGPPNAAAARSHLQAHLASINAGSASADPPTDSLYRSMELELREDGQGMPTLFGYFALFNRWNEINSFFEGRFLERNHSKSMDRTFATERDAMRVLFQHGRDPMAADKPLGPLATLEAQRKGAYYEVPLLDTQYVRELLPGLRAGLYGASYRFQVREESWNKKPDRSDFNPDGLPERTILDQSVLELGPVTFPAEQDTTAGVRSLTDRFLGFEDFTGRGDQRMAPGGDHADPSGHDETAIQEALHARDRTWRLRRTLHVH
jgi:hypothetical protein